MSKGLTVEQIDDFRYSRPVRHESGAWVSPGDARIAVCDMAIQSLQRPDLEAAAKVCDEEIAKAAVGQSIEVALRIRDRLLHVLATGPAAQGDGVERRGQEREHCSAPANGGPCVLPVAHNMGNLDIPQNHQSDRRGQARAKAERLGVTCEDEGCPHYGKPHSHVEAHQQANCIVRLRREHSTELTRIGKQTEQVIKAFHRELADLRARLQAAEAKRGRGVSGQVASDYVSDPCWNAAEQENKVRG